MPTEMIINDGSESVKNSDDAAFYWRQRDGVMVLVSRGLEAAGFQNGFSTRAGGVSPFPDGDLNLAGFNEDSAENIHENRRRFLSVFLGEPQLATVWQVHGNDVKTIRTPDEIGESDDKFDAIASDLDGILIGVKTADCVPVLIGDPVTGAFSAIHAGWRGTVLSIVARSVREMETRFGANPADMVAAIGPAACGRRYEIGQDVIDEFGANFTGSDVYFTPTTEGHALVDLHAANRDQLVASGLSLANISVTSYCTMERTDLFFSYRVEKKKFGKTGRLLSVIGRL